MTMKSETINSLTPIHLSKSFDGDTLAHFFFQNDKKAAALHTETPTEIQDLAKNGTFTGAAKSVFFIRGSYIDQINLLIAGLGTKKDFTPEKARLTGAMVANRVSSEKVKSFGISIDGLLKGSNKAMVESILPAFLEGFYLSQYTFDKYKSQKNGNQKLESIHLVSEDRRNETWLKKIIHDSLITIDCIFLTRNFSNEPSNYGTPEFYANEISKLCKTYGLKCKVMGEAEARKEKMELFLCVGAGSERESKVVIMEYTPKTGAKSAKHVSLVGKGVTFDSGGISLKPGMRMEDMKHDMTGSATMVGATLMAARLGSKNKITTILVFAENMPSGKATQPGNIIRARNGKTVEIINTDAEGRLVLGDALDLAHDYEPDVIVDTATLTGACSIALGKLASALFSNDEKLAKTLLSSTEATEEALWQLPLWDEYFEDIKSNYADMMNSANDSNGGTIRGAMFLKQFIRPGMKWAHVDLANRAYDQGYLPYNPRKGSSGVYVRTFAHFAMNF
jgi:leucyl aminopeptidase